MESIRSWSQDRYITSSPHFSAIGGGEGGGGEGWGDQDSNQK